MELYVLRHGTTKWNKKRLIQGATDIPLDGDGRLLAAEAAEGMRDIRFDACYSSPLSRARETAQIVLEGRDVEIIRDDRLREMGFGSLEGQPSKTGESGDDGRMEDRLDFDLDHYRTPPGGETMEQLVARTRSFYDEITGDPANWDKRILISTHGGAGRALMLNAWGRESFWHGSVPKNCTVCIVRLRDGAVTGVEQDVAFYRTHIKDFYG